ncbi:protein DMP10-like [Rutidosis leptorrhynchoides]|uniref:protein DMP10-like n=1 Tax=Rutidosis leptorrhynchoides TaxID=125765 RepID=UPI003A99E187
MVDQSPSATSSQHSTRSTTHKYSSHPVHKTLAAASNLANLLPTSTVLAFRALTPSFTNRSTTCLPANRFLTSTLLAISAIICFLSSFTDSFINPFDGKLYYGIATFKGLYILNYGTNNNRCNTDQEEAIGTDEDDADGLKRFKINGVDIVHALVSLFVFLVFAVSDTDVQNCLFNESGANLNVLLMNLPLGVGILASFVFTIFPTTRRGLGYADFHLPEK